MGRVVVTGAGGFVGLHLCSRLVQAGWEVVALDRQRADVTDYAALSAAVSQAAPVHAVVHLAFPTHRAHRHLNPYDTFGEGLAAAVNVMRLAAERGARHVVLASSGKVYGPPQSLPLSEDHPLAPATGLGRLKRQVETVAGDAISCIAPAAGIGVTALRLFNVYGPGQRSDFVLPHLMAAMRAGGEVTVGELDHGRDYVHVHDCAAAVACVLDRPATAGVLRPLNVGTGCAFTVRELLVRLGELAGGAPAVTQDPARLRPDEPPEERADTARLAALGWRPQVALDDGLAALWNRAEPSP